MTLFSLPVLYAALLFFIASWAGLAVLRRQRNPVVRSIAFVGVCVAAILLTLGAAKRLELLMGSAAFAWMIALAAHAGVAIIQRSRGNTAAGGMDGGVSTERAAKGIEP